MLPGCRAPSFTPSMRRPGVIPRNGARRWEWMGRGWVWTGLAGPVREILAHSCDCPARFSGFVIYG
jgi:hypothetical protein